MTLVLFGATGDLARSKLWPALHDLAARDRLPDELAVLGISRSASSEELRELAAEHGPQGGRLASGERWERLLAETEVVNGAADDPELYERLERALAGREGDRLTYLSVAPSLFAEIAGRLAGIGLGRDAGDASRIVIEKPFGEDLASSRELRAALHEHFDEEQLLRIDHYLGKEAAQNLLVLRFVNGIFEPLWDRRSIESIQVTVAEDGGVDGRGEFYDATGRPARRRPEPPAPAARADADGRAGAGGGRGAARRAPEGAALAAARRARRRRARPVRGLRRRGGRRGRLAHRHLRGAARGGRLLALGRRALLPADRQAAGRQVRGGRGRLPPVAAHPVRGPRGVGGRQPADHRHPAREGPAARHRQAPRRPARARQGRARLRRRRGQARRARGLRAPARRRDRRRHDAVHLQRGGRGAVGRDRAAAARAPAIPCPTRPVPTGRSRRARSPAATAGAGARSVEPAAGRHLP